MVRIFNYTNYRKYLKDWCDEQKKISPSFSQRNFARRGGISSPALLKSVIDRKRDLTEDSIEKFKKALKLDKEESTFFEDMVLFDQADTHGEKNYYYQRMMGCRSFLDAHKLELDSFDYFSKWYYTAIREMTALSDFVEDYGWISRRLNPSISEKDVASTIEALIDLGLLKRDEEGRLRMHQKKLVTDDGVKSVNLANFHRSMIKRAGEAISNINVEERHVGSITVAMKKEKFKEVKKQINEFRKNLWALLEDCEGAEEVYQINFQLFGLTKGDKSEE